MQQRAKAYPTINNELYKTSIIGTDLRHRYSSSLFKQGQKQRVVIINTRKFVRMSHRHRSISCLSPLAGFLLVYSD
jgi:hypothetical protein